MKTKRSAPQKKCPSCESMVHARVSLCKTCNHTFYIKKNAQQELLAKNWRDLKAGDTIKCIVGSGPYFVSKDRPGEKIILGHKGMFEVIEIHYKDSRSCGIIAKKIFARGHRANVREYIYMGEPHYDDNLSQHNEPHKIKVIKKQNVC